MMTRGPCGRRRARSVEDSHEQLRKYVIRVRTFTFKDIYRDNPDVSTKAIDDFIPLAIENRLIQRVKRGHYEVVE